MLWRDLRSLLPGRYSAHLRYMYTILIRFVLGTVCIQVSVALRWKCYLNVRFSTRDRQDNLTLKAPPIVCRRRQFQILSLFQNNK